MSHIDYHKVGKSGLRVSSLCLGTMMFGGRTDHREALQIVEMSQEAGINFVDTAYAYNQGSSEAMLGILLKAVRADWIVASKVYNPTGDTVNERGLSRHHILNACEASLRRLKRDWIDLYYLHKEDEDTPLEETVRAMGHLIEQGKIRYWGVSNYHAWRLAEIFRICRALGVEGPIASQPLYNCLNRMAEVEVIPCCDHYGVGVIPYSPLARGVLTGKYRSLDNPEPESRAGRSDTRMMQTEWRQESLDLAAHLRDHAQRQGTTLVAFAIGWVRNNRSVVCPIVGPRTVSQMRDYLEAASYRFTVEDEALVNRLVPIGHASTHGYNDPAYPIEGRRPIVA